MASSERERIRKARGAVLALFDKSLRNRLDAQFAQKKAEKPAEEAKPKDDELSDDDRAALAAEYGALEG